eukprot:CAMPEP_0177212368 /NCGR_PEP_ID=MMETSP0367-20130122/32599_1 /TAXON_ID=447022 ORGANISM="Scrippsiella hangoei-like, Strain SHHI-4" /NCGR_SAMPLE_ID=MMETSP0367 /ASSEMBLY_ACC=CAM_ASM_000362 /LENGTH=35 /DNA_ID= /DNA_START= /DNA_END= /DNA_ORIENTATION=
MSRFSTGRGARLATEESRTAASTDSTEVGGPSTTA